MDYLRFVKLRSPIWDEFESHLGAARDGGRPIGHGDLEDLAFRYRQVLHDYALAASRFPGSGAVRRLGRLALEGTHWLQRDRIERRFRPIHFVTRAFPRAVRGALAHLLLALGLFALAAVVGLALSTVQPAVGAALLGPAIAGLERGELWTDSVMSVLPPSVSSSVIATNNMTVAITAWAGGALAGLGSVYVLLLNGFMLGSVLGVTWRYSVAGRLLEFVAAHGPLEITLILMSAGAGLGIGRALVEASDRPRGEALPEAARGALVLLGGCLPWFLLLGFVEGFISPNPLIETPLKVALGIALEVIFVLIAWNPLLPEERP